MKRTFRFLVTLALVFSIGSAFTLACAFACETPRAAVESVASHCHQAETASSDLPGPGFAKPAKACPVLASLEGRDTVLHVPSFVPSFDLGLVPLPRAMAFLAVLSRAGLRPDARPPPASSPRGSRPHVLRV